MKKCLIVVNSFKPRSLPLLKEMEPFLCEKGIFVKKFIYDGNDAQNKSVSADFEGNDFVITLGGDGTVLFAARNCAPLGIPVFSVNLGEFGFLAGVQSENWKTELEKYLDGKSSVSFRALIECEVLRGGKTIFRTNCVNDCVISSSASLKLINLNVAYNHALLGPFKTNGIIVSSPTGSTGYSAAAGGPIVDPSLEAMVLTPVSSFSLSARPLVFGAKSEITITVLPSRAEVGLIADGQTGFDLQENDIIIIGIPKYKVSLICATQEKFYAALQSKLNWSGGPRA